jgi:multiple sugar transport system ATP-binding protein
MNFLPARHTDGRVTAEGLSLAIDRARYPSLRDGDVVVGIRPHDVSPAEKGDLALRVEVVEPMGFEAYAHGTLGAQGFVARLDGGAALPKVGDTLSLRADPDAVHLFHPETGRALDLPEPA